MRFEVHFNLHGCTNCPTWPIAESLIRHLSGLTLIGKTVLLEKPISGDLTEAESLAPLAKPDSSRATYADAIQVQRWMDWLQKCWC